MMFISVDLPAPFSPAIAWISPRRSSKSTPRSAWIAPNDLLTSAIFRTTSSVMVGASVGNASPQGAGQPAAVGGPAGMREASRI